MPELPEVETIKRGLEKQVVGSTINGIQVLNPKTFQGDALQIVGAKITGVWRRGKVLGVDLVSRQRSAFSHQTTLLFHLKMSGQIILVGQHNDNFAGGHPTKDMAGEMPNKSTRVIFSLSGNYNLYFNDQRKFGWIKIVDRESVIVDRFFEKLGPEPLDKAFSWHVLKTNLLRLPKTPVKAALMDQSVVAGVGNIYANEACFLAGIDPRKKANELKDFDFEKLFTGLRQTLNLGIKYGGSTLTNYVNEAGKKGAFLDFANVYNRVDKPCLTCRTNVKKITLGGRGTYFCPHCQKL